MEFKTMTIEDIITWCKANKQVEWLKAEAEKTEIVKRHTGRITVIENGKEVSKVDKKSPVVETEEPISFITLKYNFCEKFMSDILPKAAKPKKPSFRDIIKGL